MAVAALQQDRAAEALPAFAPGDLRTVATGGGAVLLGSLVGNGLSYAFGIFLARVLGPSEFGLYAVGLTVFNALSLIVLLGLDTGAVKFLSEYLGLGQADKAGRAIVRAAFVTGFSSLLAGVGLALLAGPLARVMFHKPELDAILRAFAVAIPLASLSALFVAALQAYQTVRYTLLIKYLWEPAGKFALAALCLWAGLGLIGVVGAIVLTCAVSVVISGLALQRLADLRFGERPAWRRDEVRSWAAFCLPLTLSNVFGVVAPRSDILLLGIWASAQEVGVYLAAFQTSAILSLVLGAFDTAVAPAVGRAWARQDRLRLEQAYREGTRLVVTLAIPLCLVVLFWAPDILRIFGREFAGGALCLAILTTGQVVNAATAFANTVLLMAGRARLVAVNAVAFGGLLFGATALFVPLWGAPGAAIAASAGLVALNLTRVCQVWTLFRVHPLTWSLIKPVGAGVGAAILMWGITGIAGGVPFLFPAVLLCLLYGGLLFMFGLEPGDRELLGALAHRLIGRRTA